MLSSPLVRQLVVFVAIVSFLTLLQAAIHFLGVLRAGAQPLPSEIRLAYLLFALAFPILAGWIGFRKWVAIPFLLGALFVNTLALIVTHHGIFFLFYLFYVGLYFLLDRFEREKGGQIFSDQVDVEKNENEKNQIDLMLRKLSKEVDASLAKYRTYYGLREVAERFATTLQLEKVAELIVDDVASFIPKGEVCLLYLAELEEGGLSLIASHAVHEEEKIKVKKGDFFDLWILKNRKPLLVTDIKEDIFFDANQIPELGAVRSIVGSPLVSEGRVVGVLRINAETPKAFSLDDLRLLDFISDLACSAVSNALLYQKTEELAIRDSLTGLYVQRYFKERLSEEHKRALISREKLSVLMCDLDYFKSYNDKFGHGAGDMILVRLADIMKSEVGEGGMVFRYGGEEFSVLLPRVGKKAALGLAEKIRKRVENERMEVRREPTRITISIGVSTLPDDTLEGEELVRKADQNLYEAKGAGRNRVCA